MCVCVWDVIDLQQAGIKSVKPLVHYLHACRHRTALQSQTIMTVLAETLKTKYYISESFSSYAEKSISVIQVALKSTQVKLQLSRVETEAGKYS